MTRSHLPTMVSRALRSVRLGRFLAALLAASHGTTFAADPKPGEHAAAGKEAAQQVEQDWVDGRWSQSDVGHFLASSIKTPNGWVAKGLSIRVGDVGEAAVCYDTGTPSLRAAWTWGFLKFSPTRFGLIDMPKPAGDWSFSAPRGAGWQGVTARHESMHVHGKRVVLVTRVGESIVRESPWFEGTSDLGVFTRTLELGPGPALTLRLLEPSGGLARVIVQDGIEFARALGDTNALVVARRAGPEAKLSAHDGKFAVTFPARTETNLSKILIWSGPREKVTEFEQLAVRIAAPKELASFTRPGPVRWLPAITNVGQVGFASDGFAVDTISVPYANPWKALLFCSGVDFFADGSAAVCTIHGDVWRVRGLDDKLRSVTWKRFATGLYQPLGLRVVGGRAHVLGRDQITILHDDNDDDEADRYENFSNLIATSSDGHDYATCLERDAAGNFYYVDPNGVHRVSANGRTLDALATGFRNPNGLGVGPGPIITATPQQGTWTPSSAIVEIKPGGYYGYGGPKVTTDRPLGYDAPLCWLPHAFDNSSASQVWVPDGAWGALGGKMLHLLWGRSGMALVLRDVVDGVAQGAAVGLPVKFLSGPMRGTFHPRDGHLYIAGSTGWQTSAAKDGCFQRVRFTGTSVRMPVAWHAHRNGLALTFAQALDRGTAEDSGSFAVKQWNYRYTQDYGSKDYSVKQPNNEGRDDVEIRAARVSADGKTVFLEIPDLRPVMQMEVKYNLRFTGGASAAGPLYLTLNKLADPLPTQ